LALVALLLQTEATLFLEVLHLQVVERVELSLALDHLVVQVAVAVVVKAQQVVQELLIKVVQVEQQSQEMLAVLGVVAAAVVLTL
jgi:hypothetical protein